MLTMKYYLEKADRFSCSRNSSNPVLKALQTNSFFSSHFVSGDDNTSYLDDNENAALRSWWQHEEQQQKYVKLQRHQQEQQTDRKNIIDERYARAIQIVRHFYETNKKQKNSKFLNSCNDHNRLQSYAKLSELANLIGKISELEKQRDLINQEIQNLYRTVEEQDEKIRQLVEIMGATGRSLLLITNDSD